MITLGYKLSSEEHSPLDLVRCAQMAQDSGFGFALISDHYHPWIDKQGQSPFVWGVIGAIAQATQRLTLGTAVTCPTTRLHPAIVAQAAATASKWAGRGSSHERLLSMADVGQCSRATRRAVDSSLA